MKKAILRAVAVVVWVTALAWAAHAQGGKPIERCPIDAVLAGAACMDKYEASVWRVPNPIAANKALVERIRRGYATADDLIAHGATQLGVNSDDYTLCLPSGRGCTNDVFAVSLPGVTPSSHLTWLQAQQACKNARKRLPSNAEWQIAAAGTPDPGPDNGTTDCNTSVAGNAVATGARGACVSTRGAFDMVGNLYEWVAEWTPRSTGCGAWSPAGSPTGDLQCLAGAATTSEPGALLRGGGFNGGGAGPLSIRGDTSPFVALRNIGFRCAR